MARQFTKYVLQSVIGMIGISIYILADTYFISLYSGADGLAMLNLALPIYGLMFAIGSMIGIGSATGFSLRHAVGDSVKYHFTESLEWSLIFALPFVLLGIFAPEQVLTVMGADQTLASLGSSYIRIVLIGAPLFMTNYTFTSFVRNDGAPTIAMLASIGGSGFNIAFDYIFMFPMNMGLKGAALATAISPLVTICITLVHYLSHKNQVPVYCKAPSGTYLLHACKLGVPSFVGEIAAAVTTLTFNTLILACAGNVGVAAYGVIANIALVVTSIFNGIAQGIQPLISHNYGQGKKKQAKQILKLGIGLSLCVMLIVLISTYLTTDSMIQIFNHENNRKLYEYAFTGLRLYFLGFIFASVNIVLVTYYAATNRPGPAMAGSLCRGMIAIVLCAVILWKLLGLTGIWMSFLASEGITFLLLLFMTVVQGRSRKVGAL